MGAGKKFSIGLISNRSCPECEFTTVGGNLILVPPEEWLEHLSCCRRTHDCTSALLQLWYNSWVDYSQAVAGSLVPASQTQRETKIKSVKQVTDRLDGFWLKTWKWVYFPLLTRPCPTDGVTWSGLAAAASNGKTKASTWIQQLLKDPALQNNEDLMILFYTDSLIDIKLSV